MKSWGKCMQTLYNAVCLILSPWSWKFWVTRATSQAKQAAFWPWKWTGSCQRALRAEQTRVMSNQVESNHMRNSPSRAWVDTSPASPLLSSQGPKVLAFLTSTGKYIVLVPNDEYWYLMMYHTYFWPSAITLAHHNHFIPKLLHLWRYMRKHKYTFLLFIFFTLHATIPEGNQLWRNTTSKFYRDCRDLTYRKMTFLV